MKSSILSLIAVATVAMAAPLEGHRHHKHDLHKRDVVTKVVYVNGQGQTITPSASAAPTEAASSTVATIVSSSAAAAASSSGSPASQAGSSETSSSTGSSSGGSGGISGDLSAFSGPNNKFEDGVHKCSLLPTGQGVISVDWISGLNGGWTSIMNENGDTSSTCQDGYYCSYACQAGMSKTQWPSEQPSNGISVGGLYCKNGYLYKTNSDSDYLCSWGEQTATFVSEISKDVAICRTDYPEHSNLVGRWW
jgi:SUN family beta-glucosidase